MKEKKMKCNEKNDLIFLGTYGITIKKYKNSIFLFIIIQGKVLGVDKNTGKEIWRKTLPKQNFFFVIYK